MKAECAWGDGPDVLVSLDGSLMILNEGPHDGEAWKHGAVSDGSADLTIDEAEALAGELLAAARQVRSLDELLK